MNFVTENWGRYVAPALVAGVVAAGVATKGPLGAASTLLSYSWPIVKTVTIVALDAMSWIDKNPESSLPLLIAAGSLALAYSAGGDLDKKPQKQCRAACKFAIVAVTLPLAAMKIADPHRPFFTPPK